MTNNNGDAMQENSFAENNLALVLRRSPFAVRRSLALRLLAPFTLSSLQALRLLSCCLAVLLHALPQGKTARYSYYINIQGLTLYSVYHIFFRYTLYNSVRARMCARMHARYNI